MADFEITSPEGRKFRITAPEGATKDEALAYAQEHFKAKEPSLADSLMRQVGLTARAGVEGLAGIPAMFADIPRHAYGAALQIGQVARGAPLSTLVKPVDVSGYPFPNQSQAVSEGMTKVGLPQPENATERVVHDVTGAMAATGAQSKLADIASKGTTNLTRLILDKFAEGPGMQITSAGTATAAGSTARERGAGFWGQLLATIAGGVVPTLLQSAGSAGVRALLRGGEEGRLKTAENIKTFENAGTTPTVGQATESRAARLAETMMGKTPGSAGVMANKAKTEAADIGGKVGELADSLTLRSGAAPAGRAISEGIGGEKGFIENFKAQQEKLYSELDKHIPNGASVEVGNTRSALEKLNADIPGAPNLSKWFKNGKIQGIEGALKADTSGQAAAEQGMNPFRLGMLKQLPMTEAERKATYAAFDEGNLPYEAVKKLRTLVGNEITNTNLTSDVPKSKWKALYAALSEDMGSAASDAGPSAMKAWRRANDFTSAGFKRIENVLQPVVSRADPEDIFKAATSGMQEGASTIQGVMKSLPDKSQRSVAATVLNRMGLAQAGKQDATGEVFSPETFLTNWNKMTPDSKQALFSRYGINFTKNLDEVASVASNLRDGQKIFANPSGTEAALTSRLGIAGIIYGLLFGHPGTAATLAGGMAASHVGAKYLMTNPDFVRWLAQTTVTPKGAVAGQIDALEQLAARQTPDVAEAMKKFAADLKALPQAQQEKRLKPQAQTR